MANSSKTLQIEQDYEEVRTAAPEADKHYWEECECPEHGPSETCPVHGIRHETAGRQQ